MNEFLHGGIARQKLVEIFGESATGKTQFAIQLLFNSILPEKFGGLGGKALCIFTYKHVSESRYIELKDHFIEQNNGNITSEEVDKKIKLMD
jgi:DNA repair protein RAD57